MEFIRGSWRRKWLLTPIVLPGGFHGQGRLATVHEVTESAMTECLQTLTTARHVCFPTISLVLKQRVFILYVVHYSSACLSLLVVHSRTKKRECTSVICFFAQGLLRSRCTCHRCTINNFHSDNDNDQE